MPSTNRWGSLLNSCRKQVKFIKCWESLLWPRKLIIQANLKFVLDHPTESLRDKESHQNLLVKFKYSLSWRRCLTSAGSNRWTCCCQVWMNKKQGVNQHVRSTIRRQVQSKATIHLKKLLNLKQTAEQQRQRIWTETKWQSWVNPATHAQKTTNCVETHRLVLHNRLISCED